MLKLVRTTSEISTWTVFLSSEKKQCYLCCRTET